MSLQNAIAKSHDPFGVKANRTPQLPWGPPLKSPQQKQQSQPKETPYSKPASNSGSGGSSSTVDHETVALYDQQIQALYDLLGLTDKYQETGRNRITDSYNRGVSRLNQDQSRIRRDIGIKREETSEDKRGDLGELDDDIYRKSEGMKRFFARAGSGVSGAAQILAPEALGRDFTDKRGEVFQVYGRNNRRLDLTENDAESQYKRSKEDLGLNRNDALQDLESGIGEQRIGLHESLQESKANRAKALNLGAGGVREALAPHGDEITKIRNALIGVINKYRNPALNVTPVKVDIPELEGYEYDPASGQMVDVGANQGADASVLPFLLRREQEQLA